MTVPLRPSKTTETEAEQETEKAKAIKAEQLIRSIEAAKTKFNRKFF
jgi:hypothetical protein